MLSRRKLARGLPATAATAANTARATTATAADATYLLPGPAWAQRPRNLPFTLVCCHCDCKASLVRGQPTTSWSPHLSPRCQAGHRHLQRIGSKSWPVCYCFQVACHLVALTLAEVRNLRLPCLSRQPQAMPRCVHLHPTCNSVPAHNTCEPCAHSSRLGSHTVIQTTLSFPETLTLGRV